MKRLVLLKQRNVISANIMSKIENGNSILLNNVLNMLKRMKRKSKFKCTSVWKSSINFKQKKRKSVKKRLSVRLYSDVNNKREKLD